MADKHQQTNKHQFAELEEEMLAVWDKEKTFEDSLKQRKTGERFSFFDGPPYANGLPHHGHVVPSLVKDAVARYKTMQGYFVPRKAGWDTHGLPVEQKIEQELGFNSRREIESYGIDKFNQACRDSVFRYKKEWEQFIRRLGRWIDLDNAYATFDDSYIESVWWVFRQIWEKGLVYEDFKSMPYCPRCATPLANFEVSQGYQDDVEDPSVYIKFQLKNENAAVLAWTTTPWTLPANAALAVSPDATYVRVKHNQENLILAKDRLDVLNGEFHVEGELKGSELEGLDYYPLFELKKDSFESNDNIHKVWLANFVGLDEGTGVVHIAPAFGSDDLELSQKYDIPILQTVDNQGFIKESIGLGEIEGKFFKEADAVILDSLGDGLYHSETIRHTYPFCWRCDSPLMYYAVTTWFIKTDSNQLVRNNNKINWVPKHVKDGRFGKWLEGARDWSFSRNRYWGAPLPVWRADDGEVVVVGSIEELKEKALNPEEVTDLHRPNIDRIKVKTASGKEATRVEEVFDVWFESGAVPYASNHYPFENKDEFDEIFPADFIAESIDQTRGWFYTLHVEASSLFDQPAFKNVVVSGWVVAADGQKLSKKLKNYTPVDEVFDHYGADTLRYFVATSPVVNAEDVGFSTDYLRDVQRNVFATLWNTFRFFKTYAEVDKWQPPSELKQPEGSNALDRWILSRLNQTITEVTKHADNYQINKAASPIRLLIDDLSNWYVRRSRRRFWKSEDDADKQDAYKTLHFVLVRVCQLLAPWAPFMSDNVYRQLRGRNMPKSVHLTDWPSASEADISIVNAMKSVRELVTEGLQQRAKSEIRVRQPLAKAVISADDGAKESLKDLDYIITDELNLKKVEYKTGSGLDISLDTKITPVLKREGMVREVVRYIQQARKKAQLKVDDRINLSLSTLDKELAKALKEHGKTVAAETLASQLSLGDDQVGEKVSVDGCELYISLDKA